MAGERPDGMVAAATPESHAAEHLLAGRTPFARQHTLDVTLVGRYLIVGDPLSAQQSQALILRTEAAIEDAGGVDDVIGEDAGNGSVAKVGSDGDVFAGGIELVDILEDAEGDAPLGELVSVPA